MFAKERPKPRHPCYGRALGSEPASLSGPDRVSVSAWCGDQATVGRADCRERERPLHYPRISRRSDRCERPAARPRHAWRRTTWPGLWRAAEHSTDRLTFWAGALMLNRMGPPAAGLRPAAASLAYPDGREFRPPRRAGHLPSGTGSVSRGRSPFRAGRHHVIVSGRELQGPDMTDSRYRWVIVAAGGLLGCLAIGAMFSLPVFLLPISRDTGWSVAGVSGAMTVGFVAMALASLGWGGLSDRLGPRPVVVIGSLILAASLALASRATSLVQFQLVFGLAVGGGTAAIFAPMMACVTGWFDRHRSLAVSLVSAGMGMAPVTMSPLAAWLVSGHDWRTSLRIIAALAAAVMLPVALLVRRPPALEGGHATAIPGGDHQSAMSVGQALRSPQFVILLLTN